MTKFMFASIIEVAVAAKVLTDKQADQTMQLVNAGKLAMAKVIERLKDLTKAVKEVAVKAVKVAKVSTAKAVKAVTKSGLETYRRMQTVLRNAKARGLAVTVKLNSKAAVLLAECNRLGLA